MKNFDQYTINSLLERIQNETGILLTRQIDKNKIQKYIENGGSIPDITQPLPTSLIDLITINETYFERESHHFDTLIKDIMPALNKIQTTRPIRILSAPCSSGEEIYTIALRLLTSSISFTRTIDIVGVDISEEIIQKARLGIYSQRSIHALDKNVLNNYFIDENNQYKILPVSQQLSISFIASNLFDANLWDKLGKFDIIFSRNLMIYFDSAKNKELLKLFKKHLDGYLFLGHADDHTSAKEIYTPLLNARGVYF